MTPINPIPSSLVEATTRFAKAEKIDSLQFLSKDDFLLIWSALAYSHPGLHPDGYDSLESGWPKHLKRYAVEAWRRYGAEEFADENLYACDAQWAGVYDQMHTHTVLEIERRRKMA